MKIAFVSTILGYPWGGADTLWTHAAEAALQRGDEVLLALSPLTSAHRRVQALLARGAELHSRHPAAAPQTLGARVQGKLRSWIGRRDPLANALRGFAPDLVVFSGGGTYDLILETGTVAWLRDARVPFRFVANWQTEQPSLDEAELARAVGAFAAAEGIFFVSTRNLEVTRRHLGASLPHAAVVQNPLRLDPASAPPLPWPDESVWHFASVGRLAPVKGLGLLAEAFARVLGKTGDWRLNVYGDGPEKDFLARRLGELEIADRAQLRGYESELGAIWTKNHLLVSAAVDEGVPMTIPEAMLCARPALATNVGGAADWIEPEKNGFICPRPTASALAETLDHAWSRRGSWRDLGLNARAAAAARYQPKDYLRLIAPPTASLG